MHVPIAIEAEPPGLAGILAIFVTLWVYGCGRMSSTELDPPAGPGGVSLGLCANWGQFSLLVLINAFVGGMVGIDRTVVPLIGSKEFGIASTTLVVSFIANFGIV